MRIAKAIFIKQVKDFFKNPMVSVMYLTIPGVALFMTLFVARANEDIADDMFVAMMAPIFAGMVLITAAAGVIAEDIERKSLRFLIMAGVKPQEYLIGTGGFVLLSGAVVSAAFGIMGGYTGTELIKFLVVMISGAAASVILGASIGMLSKNQQAATALSMPVAVILGFTPMIATFNATIEKVAGIFYTQQLNVVVNDFSANFAKAMITIGINAAVLLALFVFAYKKKGLKG